MSKIYTLTIECAQKGRLDHIVWQAFARICPDLSRTRFQALVRSGSLTHDGVVLTKNTTSIQTGTYSLCIDDPVPSLIEPVAMALDIVFEDDDIIVINKPAGLTVHPGAGTHDPTLVHGLLHQFKDSLSGIGGVERPGIVHRLDKETSGLMVVAKNDHAHHHLSKQFETRTLSRTYYAFVWGRPHPLSGSVHTWIGRHPQNRQKMKAFIIQPHSCASHQKKEAITFYQTRHTWHLTEHIEYTKVECTLKTGRTHQIRVHMQHIGCPVIGDPLYGKSRLSKHIPESFLNLKRQALHAAQLKFIHPRHHELMHFICDMPQDLVFLDTLTTDIS